jgi:hypothetical protein
MNTKTKIISYRKLMILSISFFGLVLLSYIILMNAVVSTGKQLTKLEDSIIDIQTDIMKVEKDMLAMRREINKENALAFGFVENSEIAYIKIDSTKTAFLNE